MRTKHCDWQVGLGVVTYVLALGGTAGAMVYRVPEDVSSVLRAADLAVPGDSILVGPGTWADFEDRWVVINGEPDHASSAAFLSPGVSLIGVDGPDQTTLTVGNGYAGFVRTILILGEGGERTRLEGLTITGDGRGLAMVAPGPLDVVDCRFVDNGYDAASILYSEAVLNRCTIVGSHRLGAQNFSGALNVSYGASLDLRNSSISGNHGGGLYIGFSPRVVVEDCEFQDNANWRAGVIQDCDSVEIRRTLFLRNSTTWSQGGALLVARTNGIVEFCTFAFDSSTIGGYGGALSCGSGLAVVNNTFFGNHAQYGGAAAIAPGLFANNIVAESTGGAALAGAPGGTSGCNVFWNNQGGDYWLDTTPMPGDLPADPGFCDPASLDFTVESTSPCLPENSPTGCELVGAWGEGCGAVAIEPGSWGGIKSLYRGEVDDD